MHTVEGVILDGPKESSYEPVLQWHRAMLTCDMLLCWCGELRSKCQLYYFLISLEGNIEYR